MTDPIPLFDDVPFTLSCYECDCDSPHCYDEAVHAGWTLIQFTPDGLAENYLGLCPECAETWNAPGVSGGDRSTSSLAGDNPDVQVRRQVQTGRQEPPGA